MFLASVEILSTYKLAQAVQDLASLSFWQKAWLDGSSKSVMEWSSRSFRCKIENSLKKLRQRYHIEHMTLHQHWNQRRQNFVRCDTMSIKCGEQTISSSTDRHGEDKKVARSPPLIEPRSTKVKQPLSHASFELHELRPFLPLGDRISLMISNEWQAPKPSIRTPDL